MADNKVQGIEGVGGASKAGKSQEASAQKHSDVFTGMSGGGEARDVGASQPIKDSISISKEAKGQE